MPVSKHDRDQRGERHLQAKGSQAAVTPIAQHDDALSPAEWLRETSASGGGQRIGDSGPVANPTVVFPTAKDSDEAP